MTVLNPAQPQVLVNPRAARIAVATIFFTNGAVLANWVARIPDVKQRIDLSPASLGIALFCGAAGALIAQSVSGWLIVRFGSRFVTTLMALLFCVTFILPGLAPNLLLLMAALFFMIGVSGGLDVAMNAQAALVEGRYGRPIMSSFHGMWSVGGLVGALLGGLAASHGVSLGLHFFITALLGITTMFLATRWLIPDAGAERQGEHGPSFALPPRPLLLMGLIGFCVLFCEGAIGDWGAVYMRDTLGSNAELAAIGYAVFALLMAAGRLTGDWLTLRFGASLLVRAGGVLVTVGIVFALVLNLPALAIIGFGLVGAGVSCIFPLILSAASRTPGVASGTAIAAMATAGYTGFLVGPPLIGTVAEALSLRGALGLLALFGIVTAVFGGVVGRGVAPHEV